MVDRRVANSLRFLHVKMSRKIPNLLKIIWTTTEEKTKITTTTTKKRSNLNLGESGYGWNRCNLVCNCPVFFVWILSRFVWPWKVKLNELKSEHYQQRTAIIDQNDSWIESSDRRNTEKSFEAESIANIISLHKKEFEGCMCSVCLSDWLVCALWNNPEQQKQHQKKCRIWK